MAKKCTSCGKEVVDEAKFCTSCGGSSFSSQEMPVTEYAQLSQPAPVASGTGITWWQILIIVAAAVAVLGIIAGIFLSKDGGSDTPDNNGGAVVEERDDSENIEIANEEAAEEEASKENVKNESSKTDPNGLNGACVINYGEQKLTLPCTVSELLGIGTEFIEYYGINESTVLAPGENIRVYLQGTTDDYVGSISAYIVNFSDESVGAGEATVIFVCFNVTTPDVSVNGITIGETKEDGFSDFDVQKKGGYIYAGTALCNIEFGFDSTDGFVNSIRIENFPDDMKKYDVEFDYGNEKMSFDQAREAALFGQFVDIDKYFNITYEDYSATNNDSELMPAFKFATVDGDNVIKLGMSYKELKALGYSLTAENENKEVSQGFFTDYYDVLREDGKGFSAAFGSDNEGTACKDGYITGFCFGKDADFKIYDITQDTNIRDVIAAYGEPLDIDSSIYDGEAKGTAKYSAPGDIEIEIDFDLYNGSIISVWLTD